MKKLTQTLLAFAAFAAAANVVSSQSPETEFVQQNGILWRGEKDFSAAETAFSDIQNEKMGSAASAMLDAVIRGRAETTGISEIRDPEGRIIRLRHPRNDSERSGSKFQPGPVPLDRVMDLLNSDEILLFIVPGINGGFFFAITKDDAIFIRLPPETGAGHLSDALRCSAAARLDPSCAPVNAVTRTSIFHSVVRSAVPVDDASTAASASFDFQLAYAAYRQLIPVEARGFLSLHNNSKLIIVSSKELLGLPWHLLITDPPDPLMQESVSAYVEAPWLFKSFKSISILPSVTALEALRGEKWVRSLTADSYLGFGDPVIGQDDGERQAAPAECQLDVSFDSSASSPVLKKTGNTALSKRAVPDLARISIDPPDGGSPRIDIEAVRRLPRLADTRCEIENAARIFELQSIRATSRKITRLLGADATESRINELNQSGELARYRTIDFATHGLIGGQLGVDQSGLILTPPETASKMDDGVLTAQEIALLRLTADMIILSACSTGAGSEAGSEPLSGLASAFFAGGARSLMVSSWPVYSSAARELITRVMKARNDMYGTGPSDSGEALTLAMTQMLNSATDEFTAHPAYWAPFLLVGDPKGEELMIMDSDDGEKSDGFK